MDHGASNDLPCNVADPFRLPIRDDGLARKLLLTQQYEPDDDQMAIMFDVTLSPAIVRRKSSHVGPPVGGAAGSLECGLAALRKDLSIEVANQRCQWVLFRGPVCPSGSEWAQIRGRPLLSMVAPSSHMLAHMQGGAAAECRYTESQVAMEYSDHLINACVRVCMHGDAVLL